MALVWQSSMVCLFSPGAMHEIGPRQCWPYFNIHVTKTYIQNALPHKSSQ